MYERTLQTSLGPVKVRALNRREQKAMKSLPVEDIADRIVQIFVPNVAPDDMLVPDYNDIVKTVFELTKGTAGQEKNSSNGGNP